MRQTSEIYATAKTIDSSRAQVWWEQWATRAHRVATDADASLVRGHDVSARDGYLRASEYYRQAFYFLRSDLDDPYLMKTYRKHRAAFAKAGPLLACDAEVVAIPYTYEAGSRRSTAGCGVRSALADRGRHS